MTDIQQQPMTRPEAERATERIRLALDRVSSAWVDLGERIADAYRRRADLALGYGSWAEYAAAELTPSSTLAADVRRQLVGLLSAEGMSTRAIAPTVGTSFQQVAKDTARQVSHEATPDAQQVLPEVTPEPAPTSTYRKAKWPERQPVERIDMETGEVLDGEVTVVVRPTVDEPREVVGLDGKTYPVKPSPTKPRRTPLPDQIEACVENLKKHTVRLDGYLADDRLAPNRKKVAARSHSDLLRIIGALQRAADRLS